MPRRGQDSPAADIFASRFGPKPGALARGRRATAAKPTASLQPGPVRRGTRGSSCRRPTLRRNPRGSPHVVDRLDRSYAPPAASSSSRWSPDRKPPGEVAVAIVVTLSTSRSHDPVCGRRSPLGLESRTHEQVSVALGSHSAGETPLSRGGLLLALHLQGRQTRCSRGLEVQRPASRCRCVGRVRPANRSMERANRAARRLR